MKTCEKCHNEELFPRTVTIDGAGTFVICEDCEGRLAEMIRAAERSLDIRTRSRVLMFEQKVNAFRKRKFRGVVNEFFGLHVCECGEEDDFGAFPPYTDEEIGEAIGEPNVLAVAAVAAFMFLFGLFVGFVIRSGGAL